MQNGPKPIKESDRLDKQLLKNEQMTENTQPQKFMVEENDYLKERKRKLTSYCEDEQIEDQLQQQTTKKEQLREKKNVRKNGNDKKDQQKKYQNRKDQNNSSNNQGNKQYNNTGNNQKYNQNWDQQGNEQNQDDDKNSSSGNSQDQQNDQSQEISQTSQQSKSSEEKGSDNESHQQYQDQPKKKIKPNQSPQSFQILNENINLLDDLKWNSSTPIYSVKYFKQRPKQILVNMISRLNEKNLKKKKKYVLKVIDGLNGIFHLIGYKVNKRNQLTQEIQIEGNLVQYRESYGIFWRYEEWEYWKWIYISQFNQVLDQMWNEQNEQNDLV